MKYEEVYDFIIKCQAISKIGLTFSKDAYALENYKELQDLSTDMLERIQDIKFDRNNYFSRDIYPTPSISSRTLIFNDKNQVLLVRESNSNLYSFPGGWCDLYDSPAEAAKMEVSQEAGLDVEITRLVGIFHRTPFKDDKSVPEYVVVFVGKPISDFYPHCHETNDVNYFDIDNLPPMSKKLRMPEIKKILDAGLNGKTLFD